MIQFKWLLGTWLNKFYSANFFGFIDNVLSRPSINMIPIWPILRNQPKQHWHQSCLASGSISRWKIIFSCMHE